MKRSLIVILAVLSIAFSQNLDQVCLEFGTFLNTDERSSASGFLFDYQGVEYRTSYPEYVAMIDYAKGFLGATNTTISDGPIPTTQVVIFRIPNAESVMALAVPDGANYLTCFFKMVSTIN
jgi:hypothetical protein